MEVCILNAKVLVCLPLSGPQNAGKEVLDSLRQDALHLLGIPTSPNRSKYAALGGYWTKKALSSWSPQSAPPACVHGTSSLLPSVPSFTRTENQGSRPQPPEGALERGDHQAHQLIGGRSGLLCRYLLRFWDPFLASVLAHSRHTPGFLLRDALHLASPQQLSAGIATHSSITGQSRSPATCFSCFENQKMRFEHSAAIRTLPLMEIPRQRGRCPGFKDTFSVLPLTVGPSSSLLVARQ